MDNRYYDKVIGEMKELFDEQGFVLKEDGSYNNGKRAVKVVYDDAAQSYVLSMALVENDNVGEYKTVNSWLFDDSQLEADAESVGMDFCESVRENIGAKNVKRIINQVDLPTVSKGETYNVTALTKKFLDVFPNCKESYKAHVTKYGNFLYLDFFGDYFVREIVGVYKSGNKKQIKKLTDTLENAYVSGDKEAVNALVAVLSAACVKDSGAKDGLFEALAENAHFKNSIVNFIPKVQKAGKLNDLLVKKD